MPLKFLRLVKVASAKLFVVCLIVIGYVNWQIYLVRELFQNKLPKKNLERYF